MPTFNLPEAYWFEGISNFTNFYYMPGNLIPFDVTTPLSDSAPFDTTWADDANAGSLATVTRQGSAGPAIGDGGWRQAPTAAATHDLWTYQVAVEADTEYEFGATVELSGGHHTNDFTLKAEWLNSGLSTISTSTIDSVTDLTGSTNYILAGTATAPATAAYVIWTVEEASDTATAYGRWLHLPYVRKTHAENTSKFYLKSTLQSTDPFDLVPHSLPVSGSGIYASFGTGLTLNDIPATNHTTVSEWNPQMLPLEYRLLYQIVTAATETVAMEIMEVTP